jgi:hypothetical protein
MYAGQHVAKPDVRPWEHAFCSTAWCKARFLYVQRCDELPELWRISWSWSPGEGGWLVAAPGPVCPMCGGPLFTSAPFEDGLEARN